MRVLQAVQGRASALYRNLWGGTIGAITLGQAAAVGLAASHIPEHLCLGVGVASIAGGVASHFVRAKSSEKTTKELFTEHGLNGSHHAPCSLVSILSVTLASLFRVVELVSNVCGDKSLEE